MSEYPKRILFATDGTEDSARAARIAVSLAECAGAELHVVHVGRPPDASTPGGTAMRPPLPGEPPGYAEREARKLLEGQVEEIRRSDGEVAEAHLRIGQPAAEMIAAGAELGTDMIVVGSGRARAIRRAGAATMRRNVLGKAADAIVRSAPCPVLVVRGVDEEVER